MSRLVVVDLDGTLIPGNSFHAWLRYIGRWALMTGRLELAARLGLVCLHRARRSITHAELKYRVLVLSESVPEPVIGRFACRLAASIRTTVSHAVRDAAHDGLTVVLATAAPQIYLGALASAIGATTAIGTPAPGPGPWRECVGDEKVDRVLAMFEPGAEIAVAFTDHLDDLPLVRRAARSVIVNPDSDSWTAFVSSGASVERLEVTS